MRKRFEDWGAHILLMAQRACVAKLSQKSVKPTEMLKRTDEVSLVNGGDKDPYYGEGVLFRHKGVDVANCAFAKPPKLVGAECIGSCLEK